MLTLKHLRKSAEQNWRYGMGRHHFGSGFEDVRTGLVSRDDTPSAPAEAQKVRKEVPSEDAK